ncbi:hypothetical protein K461DRAFT_314281 [Myriangium duriaei CBS 260.36]|uniref:Dihydroneopterin aldolase/epimerase domain-containing protein n=1 Tax=Myriangium duriaei CBS 260.36 TaxID=1168546 RepID=A0A9P4MFT9_9PEZI|nr:hypothetical protein K461DRAFT_314281 [Myriangium duriaei CBS 260.36]
MDSIRRHDGISVHNLILQHSQRVAKDAWSRAKEQPLLVTVHLGLRTSFTTAAAADSLDSSTVNYGSLSKKIRDVRPAEKWESLDDLTSRIYQAVTQLASPKSLESSVVQLGLPKASLLGSEVVFTQHRQHLIGLALPRLRRELSLRKVSIPVIIGINPHERQQKQPLVFSVALIDVPASVADDFTTVENHLVQLVERTCFETLEALILHVAHGLDIAYLQRHAPDATLHVQIEKPLAVSWAAAPCLEIMRSPTERRAFAATSIISSDSAQ